MGNWIAWLVDSFLPKGQAGVVCGHVECPHVFQDLDARIVCRYQQARNTAGIAILAAGARETHHVGGVVHPRDPHFLAIDQPAILAALLVAHGACLHVRRVGAMVRLGQSERRAELALQGGRREMLLILAGKVAQHQDLRIIGDDGMLVLQVIVQAKALAREMFADNRHGEVGPVLAAILFRQAEPEMPGLVRQALRLAQQLFPFLARQALVLEIGSGPFAAMIEEPYIVVLLLQRLDLVLDELIENDQVIGNVLWNVEIHNASLPGARLCSLRHSNLRRDRSNLCRRGNRDTCAIPFGK